MGISAAQAVNLFSTQPINFVAAQKNEQTKSNPFMSQVFSASNTTYTPNHPRIAGSETLAKHLDLDA